MSNKVLLAGGASHLWLANGSDFLLLALSDIVAVQSTPFLNVPTQRRPFLGRTHVSQMRGTENVRGRRGGNSLRPYLRKQRQSHFYPALAEVPTSDNGNTPNWVPANVKIYVDFVNDRAWTEADGEVAIVGGVLKFDDPDWGLADTANIVPGSGLRATPGGTSFPRFVDATQAALLTSGLTLVAEYDYAGGGGSTGMTFDLELYSADFNVNVFGTERDTSGIIGDGNISDNTIAGPGAVDGRYKFAVTMLAAGGISASFNNGSVHTAATETPLSALHYVGFDASIGTLVEGNYLRTVTVYTPRPDADLPALS